MLVMKSIVRKLTDPTSPSSIPSADPILADPSSVDPTQANQLPSKKRRGLSRKPYVPKPPTPEELANTQTKTCSECIAILPLYLYGYSKYNKFGRATMCLQCKNQYHRRSRQLKYGLDNNASDEITRSLNVHNASILTKVIRRATYTKDPFKCVGYDPIRNREFNVLIGHNSNDLPSLTLMETNGSSFQEYIYSGVSQDNVIKVLVELLRIEKIRLEETEMDAILSKREVYLLPV